MIGEAEGSVMGGWVAHPDRAQRRLERGSGVLRQKKEKALQAIKDGTDKQGQAIFDSYKDALNYRGAIPVISETYASAKWSFDNPQAGELNMLIDSMNALYEQAGVEGGYEPVVDVSEALQGVTDEGEKKRITQEAIAKKVKEDFEGTDDTPSIADRLAEKHMERYVERVAELEEAEERIQEAIGKEDPDRAEVRKAAFGLQRARRGLVREVGRSTRRMGREEVGEEIIDNLEGSWQYELAEERSFSDLNEEERGEKVIDSVSRYKAQLEEEGDEKAVRLFDTLDDGKKQELFERVAETEDEIARRRANLKEQASGDPDALCVAVSRIKEFELQRKLLLNDTKVAMAEQRVEESTSGWQEARRRLGRSLRRAKDIRKAGSGLVAAGKEWVASRTSLVAERVHRVLPAKDTLSFWKGETVDELSGALGKVDDVFLGAARRTVSSAKEIIRQRREDMKNEESKVWAEKERKKVARMKKRYDARHRVTTWRQEQWQKITFKARRLRVEVASKVADVVGGKEESKKAERRKRLKELLVEATKPETLDKQIAEIRKSENPHYAKLAELVEGRVKVMTGDEEVVVEGAEETLAVGGEKKVTQDRTRRLKRGSKDAPERFLREFKNPKRIGGDTESVSKSRVEKKKKKRKRRWEEQLVGLEKLRDEAIDKGDDDLASQLQEELDRVSGLGPKGLAKELGGDEKVEKKKKKGKKGKGKKEGARRDRVPMPQTKKEKEISETEKVLRQDIVDAGKAVRQAEGDYENRYLQTGKYETRRDGALERWVDRITTYNGFMSNSVGVEEGGDDPDSPHGRFAKLGGEMTRIYQNLREAESYEKRRQYVQALQNTLDERMRIYDELR
jgi:hypothetical protein